MWRGSGAAAGAGAGTEQHVAGGRGGSVPVSRRSTSRPPNKYTLHHPSQPCPPTFPPVLSSRSRQVIKNLGANPLVIQLPIGQEDSFQGLVDLVKMKALIWNGEVRGRQAPGGAGCSTGRAWMGADLGGPGVHAHAPAGIPAACALQAARRMLRSPSLRPTALLTPHLAPPALPASASPLSQELGAKFDEVEIPADMAELAAEYREKLIEQVAELDDDVMMGYLDVSGVMGYLAWPAGVAGGGLGGHHGSCRCCCRRLPPVSVLGALLPTSGLEVPPPPALPVPQPPALPAPQRPAPPAPPSPPQGELPDEATIRRLIRSGTIAGKFVPMTCGTAFKNKGVQPLLDAVVDYLPAPTDLPDVRGSDIDDAEKVRRGPGWRVVGGACLCRVCGWGGASLRGASLRRGWLACLLTHPCLLPPHPVPAPLQEMTRKSNDDEPFSGLAFKIMTDPFVGSLTFVRVYSGVLEVSPGALMVPAAAGCAGQQTAQTVGGRAWCAAGRQPGAGSGRLPSQPVPRRAGAWLPTGRHLTFAP